MKTIDTQFLTDTQINRKVQASAKRWLKERNMNNVIVSCIHGVFHATNAVSYSTTCKDILEQATGLQFRFISDGMSKRVTLFLFIVSIAFFSSCNCKYTPTYGGNGRMTRGHETGEAFKQRASANPYFVKSKPIKSHYRNPMK